MVDSADFLGGMKLVRFFCIFILLSVFSSAVVAQDFSQDEQTILKQLHADVERLGDLKSVVEEMAAEKLKVDLNNREENRVKIAHHTTMCNKGFGIACAFLAHSYRSGSLTPINHARARMLYQKACDSEYLYACGNAADMLEKGQGGRVDTLLAMSLFEKACDGDIGEACFFLARFYLIENSPVFDPKAGLSIIQKACDLEYWKGCAQLGHAYHREIGVVRNIEKAISNYLIACKNRVLQSCESLAVVYAEGVYVPRDILKAKTYFSKACDEGRDLSCSGKGMVLMSENSDNFQEAISLLERGCNTEQEGQKVGCDFLAFLKIEHHGSELQEVEHYFRLACFDNVNGYACGNSARSVSSYSQFQGDGYSILATELAERGCFLGDGFSCYHIGGAYLDGSWLIEDVRRAAEYFERACDAHFVKGCSELAEMYEFKEIASEDHEAISQMFYKKACKGGDRAACARVVR